MTPSRQVIAVLCFLSGGADALIPTSRWRGSSRTRVSMSAGGLLAKNTGVAAIDPNMVAKYASIPQPKETVMAEYVWIDAVGNTRSKTRTLPPAKTTVGKLPKWNFDGSSTDQAPGDDSEVILVPCAAYPDPFRPNGANVLVMCEAVTPAGDAIETNTRSAAAAVFADSEDQVPWFGLEQEYTLFNLDQKTPLGWPEGGFPGPQGPYYCGTGPENMFGRAISEAHYAACLFAGITISGTNGEVMPGQWEYQVGPCVGIDAGDQLMMSRYILARVCEDFQVYCTLHPKPITQGDWNGAGMHSNFSTKKMREAGGIEEIKQTIYKLGAKHAQHIAAYCEGNELRLTGKFETASMDTFSFGVANRGASIRIGRDTEADGCGYLEDRRPSSNADPYVVTGMIMETSMGPEAP